MQNKINVNEKNKYYDSLQYIINNNIKIDSILIDEYELAQINDGIKRQKKANIKKWICFIEAQRDGGESKVYPSKCDGHKNLLTLVKTTDNFKFGGFSSLELRNKFGERKDDTGFIFSLDKKENYYVRKGQSAIFY